MKKFVLAAVAVVLAVTMSGCAMISNWGEGVSRAFKGVPATFSTYDQQGRMMDNVHGVSFRVSRDERFDSVNSSGESGADSQVLMVSVGNDHISHVGSSAILAQDGVVKVADSATLKANSSESGTPILNDFIEKHRNLWQGKSKTIIVRSQDGLPLAVYAGDNVEIFATDVPKSTQLRVDGKYLFVYRVDLTIYDNAILGG